MLSPICSARERTACFCFSCSYNTIRTQTLPLVRKFREKPCSIQQHLLIGDGRPAHLLCTRLYYCIHKYVTDSVSDTRLKCHDAITDLADEKLSCSVPISTTMSFDVLLGEISPQTQRSNVFLTETFRVGMSDRYC